MNSSNFPVSSWTPLSLLLLALLLLVESASLPSGDRRRRAATDNGGLNRPARSINYHNQYSASSSTTTAAPSFGRVDSGGENNATLTVSAGQTAYFHCMVENLGDRAVTWIRRSDLKILTIGGLTYTQDKRFASIHDKGSDVWILKVTHVEVEDSGDYECQISYHDDVETKLKLPFRLHVLDSRAAIYGSPDLHLQRGSRLRLSCAVLAPSAPPAFVYWYRNGEVLNYSPQAKISEWLAPPTLQTGKDEETTISQKKFAANPQHPSKMGQRPFVQQIIVSDEKTSVATTTTTSTTTTTTEFREDDEVVSALSVESGFVRSGNYTCAPSNARPASVLVHVVDDESGPAAMQHGNGAPLVKSRSGIIVVIIAIVTRL